MYFIVPTVSVQFGSHGSRSVLSNQSFRLLPKLLSKRWSGPYVALRSPFGMPQTEERLRRFLPKQEELWVRRKRRDGKISALETCEDQNKQVSAGNLWHDCCERNLNYACEGGTAGKSENCQGEGVMKCRLSSNFPLTSPALSSRLLLCFLDFSEGRFSEHRWFSTVPQVIVV